MIWLNEVDNQLHVKKIHSWSCYCKLTTIWNLWLSFSWSTNHPRSSKIHRKMKVLNRGPYRIYAIDGHHCILKDVDSNILNDLFPLRKLQHIEKYNNTFLVDKESVYSRDDVTFGSTTSFVMLVLTLTSCCAQWILNLKLPYLTKTMYLVPFRTLVSTIEIPCVMLSGYEW